MTRPAPKHHGSESRQRTVLIGVRVTPAELESIQARAGGRPLSGWLRDLALDPAPHLRPVDESEDAW